MGCISEEYNPINKLICEYVGNNFWPNVDFHDSWDSLMAVISKMEEDGFSFHYTHEPKSEFQFKYEVRIYDAKERISRVKMVGGLKFKLYHTAIGEALKRLKDKK